MSDLKTQPNEARCRRTRIKHALSVPPCCPVSHNPMTGSVIEISYSPKQFLLEVDALRAYVDSYKGGRGNVRSMEGMIQAICQDAANTLGAMVYCLARLNLAPDQQEEVECSALPKSKDKVIPTIDECPDCDLPGGTRNCPIHATRDNS